MSDSNLTLYYNFAVDQSLAARIGPTLGITRATSATFINSSGLIETAASGIARFEYDPLTRIRRGLLVEEARTNLAVQSAAVASAPWTVAGTPIINSNAEIAPDGTLTADNINDNSGAALEGFEQLIPIPVASSTYKLSLYVKKTIGATSPTFAANLQTIGGSQPAIRPAVRLNTDTGEFTDLTGGVSDVVDAGDYWRIPMSITTLAANTHLKIRVFPATSAHGFFVDIVGAVGIATVWGIQVELGAFATSYIPTGTGVVTRAAEVLKTTDISDINTAEGVFYIDFTTGNIDQDTTILSLDSEMSSNRMALEIIKTSGNIRFRGVDGGVAQWSINTAATADTDYRAAIAYKANDIAFYLNGTQVGVESLATIPAVTTLHIGCDFNELEQLNEHIRQVRHYNVRKDNTFLQSLVDGIINEDSINLSANSARPMGRKLARPY